MSWKRRVRGKGHQVWWGDRGRWILRVVRRIWGFTMALRVKVGGYRGVYGMSRLQFLLMILDLGKEMGIQDCPS